MDLTDASEKILLGALPAPIPNTYLGTHCLELETTGSQDYPKAEANSSTHNAHRVVYFAAHPELEFNDNKLQVRHMCHNTKCVRLDHLLSGSPRQNSLDARDTGRRPNAQKLTLQDVEDIRGFLLMGWTGVKIAEYFNVSSATISMIKHGKVWGDV